LVRKTLHLSRKQDERDLDGTLNMRLFGADSNLLTRRGLVKSAGAATASGLLLRPSLALARTVTIDVTAAPYGADPNTADNSPAFQSALSALSNIGGGRLYVPGGFYTLASPLTYSGGALTIFGDGPDSSVLVNSHSGTVISVNFSDTSKCLTVRELGFSPCSGAQAQGAIAVTVVAQPSGWQNAIIENVSIGIPDATSKGQYTSYNNAILLTNTTRARINNVNVHANNIAGGSAVALSGACIDTRVLGCTLEGYNYGVYVLSYCEGLHLANNVIICGTAVHTGVTNYNTGAFAINLLELLMSDCEINTMMECLYLYQVKNAQITNCHFTGPKSAGGAAIDLRGCSESLVENCTFCGVWTPSQGAALVGIAFNPSSRMPTTSCHVSDVQFENTTIAIYFGPNAQGNTATNVGQLTYGTGWFVDGMGAHGQAVYGDVSGNTTNNAAWLTTANTMSAGSRRINSQH
jgi:hypothetical protein